MAETGKTQSTKSITRGARIVGTDRDSLAAELREKYDSGESIRSLAGATGRSYGFIHRILNESGATMRRRGGTARRTSTSPG